MGKALFLLLSLVLSIAKLPAEECKLKGFTEQLMCSSCALLTTYMQSYTELHAECRQCCTPDEGQQAIYTEAILDYNPKYILGYPGISEFITTSAKQFPNLRLITESRLWPKLLLISAEGKVTEELIRYWSREDLEEFLTKRLVKPQEKPQTSSWFSW
jgi:hypothetical protein